MSKSESKKCEKCGTNRIGFEWIESHVHGVMRGGKDPRTATGRENTLNQVQGLHKLNDNDGVSPCSTCISAYGEMINDAIDSFKNQK